MEWNLRIQISTNLTSFKIQCGTNVGNTFRLLCQLVIFVVFYNLVYIKFPHAAFTFAEGYEVLFPNMSNLRNPLHTSDETCKQEFYILALKPRADVFFLKNMFILHSHG